MTDRESMQPEQRTGNCLLTGVCAAEGHCIQKAQREWHGLTDEEKEAIYRRADEENWHDQPLLEAVEAKLREKNSI